METGGCLRLKATIHSADVPAMPRATDTPSPACREWTIWVVPQPGLDLRGISLEWDGSKYEIEWGEIGRAFAAEVGEPDGIRAVVFDLVWNDGPDGAVMLRFSVDPSDGPKHPAQLFVDSLGGWRCSASLQSLARDGRATDRFSHVDALDEALLEQLAAS